jgi:hypothetical protein
LLGLLVKTSRKPNKNGIKIIADFVFTKRPQYAKLSLFKTNTRPGGTRKLEREENMTTTATVSENLLRQEYEVEGVTTKTLIFGVCYLPPSAVRRHTRNGIPLVQAIQTGSTPSFCKNEPLFKTRAEAQARCDARNAGFAARKETYFHVIECWAVPVVARIYRGPSCYDELSSKEKSCYLEAQKDALDFEGEHYENGPSSIDREYFDR